MLVSLLLLCQSPTAQAKTIWAVTKDTVWRVERKFEGEWQSGGTAFIVSYGTKQYAITCKHVLEAKRLVLKGDKIEEVPYDGFRLVKDGFKMEPKWVHNPVQDAAAAVVSGVKSTARLALLQPMIGDKVFSLGFPANQGLTIGEGIVNRKASIFGREYLGHSADIFFGNSGGPLFSESAEVVGINSNMLADANNLYFSEIPGQKFKDWLMGL
jgi:S1-C subfamily serine protease